MSKAIESLALYIEKTIAVEGSEATIRLKTLKEWIESWLKKNTYALIKT